MSERWTHIWKLLSLWLYWEPEWGLTVHTLAALLTLSSLPRLWTNTEAGFPSWRAAEYMVSPEGSVMSGSPSRVQPRSALLSAPMAARLPARAFNGRHTETEISTTAFHSKRTNTCSSEADKPELLLQPLDLCWISSWCRLPLLANFVTTLASLSIDRQPPRRHAIRSLALV